MIKRCEPLTSSQLSGGLCTRKCMQIFLRGAQAGPRRTVEQEQDYTNTYLLNGAIIESSVPICPSPLSATNDRITGFFEPPPPLSSPAPSSVSNSALSIKENAPADSGISENFDNGQDNSNNGEWQLQLEDLG